jgi:hypothetical protein
LLLASAAVRDENIQEKLDNLINELIPGHAQRKQEVDQHLEGVLESMKDITFVPVR